MTPSFNGSHENDMTSEAYSSSDIANDSQRWQSRRNVGIITCRLKTPPLINCQVPPNM